MKKSLQVYLEWRCRVNWHPKYYKYISTWVANVTHNQCHYFEREMNNLIDRGISGKSKEDITKKLSTKALDDVLYTHNYSPERILGSAIGDTNGNKEYKLWVVDVDFIQKPDAFSINKMLAEKVRDTINSCRPEGNKIFATVPTRHGMHFITFPFDVQEFNKAGLDVEVKKDNPTLLYYPESLDSNELE